MAGAKRSVGTVKWFNGQKGFGFIAQDDGGEDLFVHQTEIRSDGFRTLREGQRVEFKVDSAEDGRSKAVDVVGVTGPYRSGGGWGSAPGRGSSGGGRRRYGSYGGGGIRGGWRGASVGVSYRGGGGEGVECYNCGGVGHFARDCYRDNGGGGRDYRGGRTGNQGYVGGRGGRGRGGGGSVCYHCGEEGHFARDCPTNEE